MSGIDDILAGYESLRAGQEAFYKDLHQHPELSHAEHRTARRVAEQLQDAGLTIASGIGGTGVVGVLANGSGPAVLLRCELDALPLREATGAPYASTATASDASGQEVPVDHACGHDMHTACMTGMATLGSPCPSSPTAELGRPRPVTQYGSEPRRALDQRLSTSPPLKRTPRPRQAVLRDPDDLASRY